jgi:hypothetical protein
MESIECISAEWSCEDKFRFENIVSNPSIDPYAMDYLDYFLDSVVIDDTSAVYNDDLHPPPPTREVEVFSDQDRLAKWATIIKQYYDQNEATLYASTEKINRNNATINRPTTFHHDMRRNETTVTIRFSRSIGTNHIVSFIYEWNSPCQMKLLNHPILMTAMQRTGYYYRLFCEEVAHNDMLLMLLNQHHVHLRAYHDDNSIENDKEDLSQPWLLVESSVQLNEQIRFVCMMEKNKAGAHRWPVPAIAFTLGAGR